MRKLIITVIAVLAVATGGACSLAKQDKVTGAGQGEHPATAGAAATANLPAGPKKFDVGQHATLTLGNGSTADIVVSKVQVQGKSVVATVTIQCTSGEVAYNAFDWTATAADGTKLDVAFDVDVKNALHSGDLGSGQKVTGTLSYEGTSAKGVTVTFMSGLSGALAYWVNP